MMTPGVVSEVICDDPKITEHRIYDIGFHAYRYRWDCGNKSLDDIFYIHKGNQQKWLDGRRQFVMAQLKEQDNG